MFRLDLTPEQASSLADELTRATQAGLFHPSIVEPVAAGLEGTVAYRAEEYVAAESLDVAMRHYAPATLDKALPFITQLASAIDFARAAGVGHGALHPRDIFVTPDEARATGFGVVDALERLGQRAPVRRPYSPPERIEGRPWSTPADVFSLAVIAFELLTGRRPAGVGDQMGTLAGASLGDNAEAIRAVLARAMAEAPEDRYATAAAFASALAEAAGSPELASALAAAVSLPKSSAAADDSAAASADEESQEATADALLIDSGESPREAARKAIAARKRQMKDAPPPPAPEPPPAAVEAPSPIDTPAPVLAEAPPSVAAAIEPGAVVDLEPAAAVEAEPVAVVATEPAAAADVEPAAAVDPEPAAPAEAAATEVEPAPVAPPEAPLPPVEPFRSEKTFPKPKTREHRSRKVERREGEPVLPLAAKTDTPKDPAEKPGTFFEPPNVREFTAETEPALAAAGLGAVPDLPLAPPPPLPIATAIDDLGTVTGAAAGASAAEALLTPAASRPSESDDEAPAAATGDRAASETPLLRDVSDRVVAVDEFRARDAVAPRADRSWPRLSDRPPTERALASNPSPIEPSERVEPVLPAGARDADELRRDRSGLAMLPLAVMLIVGLLIGYMIRDFIGERDRRETPAVAAGVQPAAAPAGGQSPATDATDQVVAPPAPTTSAAAAPPVTAETKPPAPAPRAAAAAKPNAAAPKTGTIIVTSTPSKAAVTVNGRWSGRTPLRLNERPFGKYSVRVVLEGYEVARQDFALSASSATRTIDVDLKRRPSAAKPAAATAKPAAAAAAPAPSGPAATTGDVFVDSRPQGARVLIDGREVGVTPFRVPGVTPGTYAVRLELADHAPWTATAKVVAGETARVTGSLDRIR